MSATRRAKDSPQQDLFGEPDQVVEDLRGDRHSRAGKGGKIANEEAGQCARYQEPITTKNSIELNGSRRCGPCYRGHWMGLHE